MIHWGWVKMLAGNELGRLNGVFGPGGQAVSLLHFPAALGARPFRRPTQVPVKENSWPAM